jgi:hypothetical protein
MTPVYGSVVSKRGLFLIFLVIWVTVSRVNRAKQAGPGNPKAMQVIHVTSRVVPQDIMHRF